MITCSACRHQEYEGTLFCSECGAQLVAANLTQPNTILYPSVELGPETPHADRSAFQPGWQVAGCTLKMLATGQVLELSGTDEYTLGRASSNQPILPDIDLAPFQAYEAGVSRLHATLKIKDKIFWITDLGSANGTRVNGQKIPAHIPFPLEHEDILTLGNLKVQILLEDQGRPV